ncbi:hypothetical protein BH20ACI1_BH20ACI1_30310 [soil metagenome]
MFGCPEISGHPNRFYKMDSEKITNAEIQELPDSWWYRVYLGVIISNILVILALGTFTYYFSS